MAEKHLTISSDHDEGGITNTSDNPSFDSILQIRLSRRQLLRGTAGAAAMAVFGGIGLSSAWAAGQQHRGQGVRPRPLKLNFAAVPKSLADVVAVPPG
ncbi:MAG: twin-arginine translocation signal domain-containing protein, partial [Gammaproteobacteria bacterium]